ncbi:MAG: hypothetical protein HRT57_01400 [Crocinitomicaceae bacterium]|nr:hypothetical protein [Crocinitomicaceae bacterium]
MSKSNTNALYLLIHSLSKAEKRHFRSYAKRNFGEKDIKFLTLFDLLDKQSTYNSEKIRGNFSGTSISAISNLKSHLYEQLLISLRLLHRNDSSVKIHELLSFANVLYSKGLYLQSLEQLKRARVYAESMEDDLSLHAIIEMERRLELFYVTDSGENRASDIVLMNVKLRSQLDARDNWSNIALLLYDYYLKYGHVKNQNQFKKVEAFFKEQTEHLVEEAGSMQGRVYRHMAYTWYYFITQNFALCYRHASDWINLVQSKDILLSRDPIFYLKGMHNALSALFYSNKPRQFNEMYGGFKTFIEERKSEFDHNTLMLIDVYKNMAELNQRFLAGQFRGNETFILELKEWLEANDGYLDQNRIQVFNYKIACLYFGADDFKNCIVHLNKIIHSDVKEKYLKQDVQCFARVLNLVAHYELGNDDLVEYQLKSTYRFLIKYGDLQKVQEAIIGFIRTTANVRKEEVGAHFVALKEDLVSIFDDPFERRPLLYLDLISWLTSRIENVPVEKIIRARQELR